MAAHYLIRFDDLCPTMNWEVWTEVETTLLETGIVPILGVVPDNQDRALVVSGANGNFWNKVREWQTRGWALGLHGYQHTYVTQDAGLVGIAPYSEFSGLPYEEQAVKLRRALEIFRRERVHPDLWIAPAHSFDANTVAALRELGIRVISDGLFLAPHLDPAGVLWIPQQLWQFRRRPFGVWTVCYHHNGWTARDLARFRADLRRFRRSISNPHTIVSAHGQRRCSVLDSLYAGMHSAALAWRRPSPPVR